MIVRSMSRLLHYHERVTKVTLQSLKAAELEYERRFPWSLKRATAAGKIKALKEIYFQLQIIGADERSLSKYYAQQDLISL